MAATGTTRTVHHRGRDIHLFLRPDLYAQIASLAQANRRTLTAEVTLAVECYLEQQAIRGSQRHAELAGERGWMETK